ARFRLRARGADLHCTYLRRRWTALLQSATYECHVLGSLCADTTPRGYVGRLAHETECAGWAQHQSNRCVGCDCGVDGGYGGGDRVEEAGFSEHGTRRVATRRALYAAPTPK